MTLDPEYPPRCAACGHPWGMHDPLGRCLSWVPSGPGIHVGCSCQGYPKSEVR